jgi:subtilisin family serine protease
MNPRFDRRAYLDGRNDVETFGDGVEWFRPGELLVNADHVRDLDDELQGLGGLRDDASPVDELGVLRYRFASTPEEAPRRVARDLDRRAHDGPPLLSLNTVFHGEPKYSGGPATVAEPAIRFDPVDGPADVTVGILDTGLAPHAWLSDRVEVESHDEELLDEDGDGLLDAQAGHGTFIAGIVRRYAPAARIRVARVLDSHGVTDELTIATELARLGDVHVVNLSLGGYTLGDRPPLAFARALLRLHPKVVIVAAAGNAGIRDRPFWPAAFPFPRVVAVAALGEDGKLAEFSNYGRWVDMARPGVDVVSTFPTFNGSRPSSDTGDPDRFDTMARWSGTSFAAARVTGEIAARMQRPPSAAEAVASLPKLPGDPRPDWDA